MAFGDGLRLSDQDVLLAERVSPLSPFVILAGFDSISHMLLRHEVAENEADVYMNRQRLALHAAEADREVFALELRWTQAALW